MSRGVLVHEWLDTFGGAERVFEEMAAAFPGADILRLWDEVPDRFPGRRSMETWLARTPLRKHKALALPFMPATWRNRPGGPYDWALVSAFVFAHHLTFADPAPGFRKYVYVHTPFRSIWEPEVEPRGQGLLPRLAAPVLKSLDRRRSAEPMEFAANARHVQERIERFWGQPSRVIYPPVEVAHVQSVTSWADKVTGHDVELLESLPDTYLLGLARMVGAKRLDLVINAGEAAGVPVVLVGDGPVKDELVAKAEAASVPVTFIDPPSYELKFALYERALAHVFPGVDPFGITPVESMAAGTPVIARNEGGATETVLDGRTGVLLDDFEPSAVRDAVSAVEGMSSLACRVQAMRFDTSVFHRSLHEWMADVLPQPVDAERDIAQAA